MTLYDAMHNFTDKIPPEDIELLVCDNQENHEHREFERAFFYKKGSMLPHEYRAQGENDVERFLDHMANYKTAWEPAKETGYYILVNCPAENRLKLRLCHINPLDSKYIVIDPLEDKE